MKTFIILDIKFENWEISLGPYHQIFPSFSWGIFDHMMLLDQKDSAKIFDGL